RADRRAGRGIGRARRGAGQPRPTRRAEGTGRGVTLLRRIERRGNGGGLTDLAYDCRARMGAGQSVPPPRTAKGLSAMNRERWRQIDDVFEGALERAVPERAAFLDRACAGDAALRAEVDALLAAHGREDDFMERPASADAARRVLEGTPAALGGQVIGSYKIISKLGVGGMGEVYLAENTRLARPAALKLLAAHLTADEERVRRFRREALAASALNHPNILTVYEVGRWQGRDFIATEFVAGVTLRTRMRGKKLSLADALDIALQVASALVAAHAAGIVHRDIKPENIM